MQSLHWIHTTNLIQHRINIKRSLKLTNISFTLQFFSHNRQTPLNKVYESVSFSDTYCYGGRHLAYSMHTQRVGHRVIMCNAFICGRQREQEAASLHSVTRIKETQEGRIENWLERTVKYNTVVMYYCITFDKYRVGTRSWRIFQ